MEQLQSLPLDVKIRKTQIRIREFYEHYGGQVYVSFSGGKDSTVLLDIARKIYPDIKAVYIDTGLEYPEIKEFVKTIDNVEIIRPKMTFKEVIEKYGYPVVSKEVAQQIYEIRNTKSEKLRNLRLYGNGNSHGNGKLPNKYRYLLDAPFKISSTCCRVMKKSPAESYEKKNNIHPILGMMAVESMLRKQSWVKYGCNAFDLKRPQSKPISFWTEQDVLKYIKNNNLSYASVYGEIKEDNNGNLFTTGCERTGCIWCCFGAQYDTEPTRFQKLKITHPSIWNYCINKLDLKMVLEYMQIPYE